MSQYEGEPEYQLGVQSEDARTVPDVAADANPSTGVAVYDSLSDDGESGWMEFGGTSAAAPQWAGLIAIADQGRVLNKLGTLNGATNTLPTLYSLKNSAGTYSGDFHDITSGATSYAISASTGYDLVTGLGSAKANELVPALVSSTVNTKLTLTSLPAPQFPFPMFGPPHGFFVITSQGAIPAEVNTSTTTSFTTTLHGVSPLAIEGALFASSFTGSVPQQAMPTALPAQTFADVPLSTSASAAMLSSTARSTGISQQVERELNSVYQFAQAAISQLVRDMAIELAHVDSAAVAAFEQITSSTPAISSAVAIAAAAALAGSVIGKDSDLRQTGASASGCEVFESHI